MGLPDVESLRTRNPDTTAFMGYRKAHSGPYAKDLRPFQVWVPLEAISPNLAHAVLIAEDDTFYRHHGFDFDQIREAIRINWKKGRYAYGGSTLTQQLARNLYLTPEKTLLRKAREAIIAWRIERMLTKRRILEIYLNVAEWGPGIYGAQAAAQTFFGKEASELTIEESIALASALPSPGRLSPLHETESLSRRRRNILERMQQAGYLPTESLLPADGTEGGERRDSSTPGSRDQAGRGTLSPHGS